MVGDSADYALVTQYLAPGVRYGHIALKQAYYAACSAGMNCKEGDEHWREGEAFRVYVHGFYKAGFIEMTTIKVSGEDVDFFTAVIAARHKDHPEFRLIPGYLVVTI